MVASASQKLHCDIHAFSRELVLEAGEVCHPERPVLRSSLAKEEAKEPLSHSPERRRRGPVSGGAERRQVGARHGWKAEPTQHAVESGRRKFGRCCDLDADRFVVSIEVNHQARRGSLRSIALVVWLSWKIEIRCQWAAMPKCNLQVGALHALTPRPGTR